jgi:hypothetical protein
MGCTITRLQAEQRPTGGGKQQPERPHRAGADGTQVQHQHAQHAQRNACPFAATRTQAKTEAAKQHGEQGHGGHHQRRHPGRHLFFCQRDKTIADGRHQHAQNGRATQFLPAGQTMTAQQQEGQHHAAGKQRRPAIMNGGQDSMPMRMKK